MSEEVYTRLREFLDKLPAGYPKTPGGVEMKILKKLFTPEDAELVMKLSVEPEELSAIARRIGMDESELQKQLDDLCVRGLIFRIKRDGKSLYQAFHFVVGIWEFQVNRLDKELSEMFEEYLPFMGISMMNIKTPQLRVIPVESAIGTGSSVANYNKVREMVRKEKVFSVQECICRKEQSLLGHECSHTKEGCLGFGDFAQFYIDNGWAKQITMDEMLKILDEVEEEGLVLQSSNANELFFICCCCSCCDPSLKFSKLTPRPVDMVRTYYEAKIDPDECSACGDCIERCQMAAIKEGDDYMKIIDGRCIGCGLCVSACPTEAISLVEKAGMDEVPPQDFQQVLKKIRAERGIS